MYFQNFTNLSDKHQQMVLDWRNHLSIRKWMGKQDIITNDEHRIYLETLKVNNIKRNHLCFLSNQPIGVITYHSVI